MAITDSPHHHEILPTQIGRTIQIDDVERHVTHPRTTSDRSSLIKWTNLILRTSPESVNLWLGAFVESKRASKTATPARRKQQHVFLSISLPQGHGWRHFLSGLSSSGPSGGVLKTVTFSLRLDDLVAMRQPVERGPGESF